MTLLEAIDLLPPQYSLRFRRATAEGRMLATLYQEKCQVAGVLSEGNDEQFEEAVVRMLCDRFAPAACPIG